MKEDEIRRAALRRLIADRYAGITNNFATEVDKPASQINDMLATPPRKSFGEKIARQFEKKIGLPRFFFERTETVSPDCRENKSHSHVLAMEIPQLSYNTLNNDEQALIVAWRNCNQDQRDMFRLLVSQVAKNFLRAA